MIRSCKYDHLPIFLKYNIIFLLHLSYGFPHSYQFVGSERQTMGMVIDSVMPLMAYALGKATQSYLEAIEQLAEVPRPLGYRELISERERQRQLDEALEILYEPVPVESAEQLVLWT